MKNIFLLLLIFLTGFAAGSSAQTITTIAGTGVAGYSGDGGPAIAAEIKNPTGITIGPHGDIYFCDEGNAVVRRINTAGIVTTFAGNSIPGFSGDGGMATDAQLAPLDIASDQYGNVFIVNFEEHVVRKVETFGIITTVAGIGMSLGFSGDGGPATDAQLAYPTGVAVDKRGNIYIADFGFHNYRIRKVDTSGIITTICGTGTMGFSGDGGPATLAEINSPRGITVDKTGNVYFTDVTNNRIRKIDTAGIITTVGGNGIYGYNGENIPATDAAMRSPDGLTIDSIGNLYFAENDNDRVRKIGVNGLINTVIGNGLQGYSGDGGDPLSAELYWPASVALDLHNNIFVTDAANNRIRMVRYNVSVGDIEKPESNVIISPNPSTGIFSVSVSTPATETFEISVTDLIGREVLRTHATSNKPIKILLQQHEGVYYLQAANEHRILKEKIVVIK